MKVTVPYWRLLLWVQNQREGGRKVREIRRQRRRVWESDLSFQWFKLKLKLKWATQKYSATIFFFLFKSTETKALNSDNYLNPNNTRQERMKSFFFFGERNPFFNGGINPYLTVWARDEIWYFSFFAMKKKSNKGKKIRFNFSPFFPFLLNEIKSNLSMTTMYHD